MAHISMKHIAKYWWEGRKFKHPETENLVHFKSLPLHTQKELNDKVKKVNDDVEKVSPKSKPKPKERKIKIEFKEAKTIEEANAYAKENLVQEFGKVDFGTMFLKDVNIINNEITKLVNTYHVKPDYIGCGSKMYRSFLTDDEVDTLIGKHLNWENESALNPLGGGTVWDIGKQKHVWQKGCIAGETEMNFKDYSAEIKGRKFGIIFNDEWYSATGEHSSKEGELGASMARSKYTGFHLLDTKESIIHHEFGHLIFSKEYYQWNKDLRKAYRKMKEKGLKRIVGGYADSDGIEEWWAEAFAIYQAGGTVDRDIVGLMKKVLGTVGKSMMEFDDMDEVPDVEFEEEN